MKRAVRGSCAPFARSALAGTKPRRPATPGWSKQRQQYPHPAGSRRVSAQETGTEMDKDTGTRPAVHSMDKQVKETAPAAPMYTPDTKETTPESWDSSFPAALCR